MFSRHRARRSLARCILESLENRQLLAANVFVVPAVGAHVGANDFTTLAAAVTAAGTGGTVTIMAGSSPEDGAPVFLGTSPASPAILTIATSNILIQGDPNLPPTALPLISLDIGAANVTLRNLNMLQLELAGSSTTGLKVQNAKVYVISGGPAVNSSFTGNTINAVDLSGDFADSFVSNTFYTSAQFNQIKFTNEDNLNFSSNTIYGDLGNDTVIINGTGSTAATKPTLLSNNLFHAGSGFEFDAATVTTVNNAHIVNNTFDTAANGTGIFVNIGASQNDHTLALLIQGNDFRNDQTGILYNGSGAQDADLGGGDLGSLGANDFRTFTAARAAHASYALNVSSNQALTISMHEDLIASGAAITDIAVSNGAVAPTYSFVPLSDDRAFVQSLYNATLGRSGSLNELDYWTGILADKGPAAVATGIANSAEAYGLIINGYYRTYLGRAADTAGRTYWVNLLVAGATLESIQASFITTPEYLSKTPTDTIQSYYVNLLGRSATGAELATWYTTLSTQSLLAVATSFLKTAEYRTNAVTAMYESFLVRTPSASELSFWVNGNLTLLQIRAGLLGSAEYMNVG